MLAVLNAVVLVLGLVLDFPVWVSAAVIGGSVAGAAVWLFFPRRHQLAPVLSAAGAAVVFGFAAEGVRGVLTDDTPSSYHYYVVKEVYPTIAPETNAGQALDAGLLFSGDSVDVVCVEGSSWAKLKDGSWVPADAVQPEVDAKSAPRC